MLYFIKKRVGGADRQQEILYSAGAKLFNPAIQGRGERVWLLSFDAQNQILWFIYERSNDFIWHRN